MVEHYAAGEGQGEDAPKVSHLQHSCLTATLLYSAYHLPFYTGHAMQSRASCWLGILSCTCTTDPVTALSLLPCLHAHLRTTLMVLS